MSLFQDFQGSLCLNASDSVGNMVTHVSYEQLRALRTTHDFLLPRQGFGAALFCLLLLAATAIDLANA